MTAPVLDIKDAVADAVAAVTSSFPSSEPTPEPATTEEPKADDVTEDEDASADATESTAAADAAPETADDEAEEEASESDAITLPEGFVAVPAVDGALATEFKLLDEDGELEIPSLIVEYKADNKVRKDRLDQVVKLAQVGVYAQNRIQKAEAEAADKIAEREATVAEREAQIERMLTDPDFYERVLAAYEAETTPERRAERAEEELGNLRLSQQMQTITEQGERFYATEVEPALSMIVAALPTITAEELNEKIEMALLAQAETAPNGEQYVPPSRYEAVRKYIVDDLALWAQAAHARRSRPAAQAQPDKKPAALDADRVAAQRAKRDIGRKLKPVVATVSGAAPDKPAEAPKPTTVDDAMTSAVASVMASLRS